MFDDNDELRFQFFPDGPSHWAFENKIEAECFAKGCEELFDIQSEILKTAPIKDENERKLKPFFVLFEDGVDSIGSEHGHSISLYYAGFDAAIATLKGLSIYDKNPNIRKNY